MGEVRHALCAAGRNEPRVEPGLSANGNRVVSALHLWPRALAGQVKPYRFAFAPGDPGRTFCRKPSVAMARGHADRGSERPEAPARGPITWGPGRRGRQGR